MAFACTTVVLVLWIIIYSHVDVYGINHLSALDNVFTVKHFTIINVNVCAIIYRNSFIQLRFCYTLWKAI